MTSKEGPLGDFPRKADGRRVCSPEFKWETVRRILSGEKTIAFVKTLKRDYIAVADLRDAESVLLQQANGLRITTPGRPIRRSTCGARPSTGPSLKLAPQVCTNSGSTPMPRASLCAYGD